MNELKPCPFCGGDKVKAYYTGSNTVAYFCSCGVSTAFCYNENKAIAAWNRRAELPDTVTIPAKDLATLQRKADAFSAKLTRWMR